LAVGHIKRTIAALDFLLLPIDKRLSFNRNRKAQVFKDFLFKVGQHIENMNEQIHI